MARIVQPEFERFKTNVGDKAHGLRMTLRGVAGSLKAASSSQDQQVVPESIAVLMHGSQIGIVTGTFEARGVKGGKRYVRRERFVDTWVYKHSKWVCVATNAIPVLH